MQLKNQMGVGNNNTITTNIGKLPIWSRDSEAHNDKFVIGIDE